MRVRHCTVRVIVRQPWLFADPQALSVAITCLVTDVLAIRLSTRLDRIGQPAHLGTVAMRAMLPAPVVLGLADQAPSGPAGRRLPSFSAEVAVHDAASGALRAAFEQIAFELSGWREDPDDRSRAGPDGRRGEPGQAAGTGAITSRAAERLVAAVGGTLLAAVRLGRLRQLLQQGGPALAAEWVRLLTSAAGSPLLSVTTEAGVPAVRPATADDRSGQAGTRSRGQRQASAGAGDGAVGPNGRDAVVVEAGSRAGSETPEGRPSEPAASRAPSTAAEAAVGGAIIESGGEAPEREPPESATYGEPPTAADVEVAAHGVLDALEGTADAASVRLEAAASLAARLHLFPSDPRAWHALEPLLAHATAGPEDASGAEMPGPPAQASPLSGRRHPPARRELGVASVLPFLLVGPLDDLGVLDAIAAALAGPGWSELLTAFAAALARKVLPPPANGWRQPTEVTATVAAFVGHEHSLDRAATERLGRTADRWWPVVEEALTAELVDLRAEGSPLVVTRSPGGLVAADADGLAPLLWDGDNNAVRRLWERCGRPAVLADASLATSLAALGPSDDPAQLEPLAELVALAGERPAGGRADLAPQLDGPISLVAGVALAALAWELWQRHRERTHPALAVRRLGDLDGRVSLEPDRVIVRMPLGRRHADLRDSGLLRTVVAVPWLDGRSLELQGG